MAVDEGGYSVTELRDCELSDDRRPPGTRKVALEVGAELGVVPVRKTGPKPEIRISAHLGLRPGATQSFPLDAWMSGTAQIIQLGLLSFAEPPDDLARLGDPDLASFVETIRQTANR
jgi:hypothetical protein